MDRNLPRKVEKFLNVCHVSTPGWFVLLAKKFMKQFSDMLSLATANLKETIILGGLNVNYLKSNDHHEIKNIMSLHGFKQTVKTATRITKDSSTLIDIISTNNPTVIKETHVIPMAFSDHDMVGCVRKLNFTKFNPKQIKCRNFKNDSKEALCDSLQNSD